MCCEVLQRVQVLDKVACVWGERLVSGGLPGARCLPHTCSALHLSSGQRDSCGVDCGTVQLFVDLVISVLLSWRYERQGVYDCS